MDDVPVIRIDLRACRVWQGRTELRLSAMEFGLLALLVSRAGAVIPRQQIMREVWGSSQYASKTLDMHISWLRRKLGDAVAEPRYIVTVRGIGYRFDGRAEVVGSPVSPMLADDGLALARAVLADLREMADRAAARVAELERAREEVTSCG